MTAAEFTATRHRLGLTVEQVAADFGVTPHVVEAWDRGAVRVSADTARQLRWRSAIAERHAVVAASGLPDCPTAEALDRAVAGKTGEGLFDALDQLTAHGTACTLCRARVEYADRHGPPLPELPVPRWIRIASAISASFDRLPAGLRPPAGIQGRGRRMGLWFGVAFSSLALLIAAVWLARAPGDGRSWREAGTLLVVVIPAYFIGFYCAGVVYDALRPIGHRFIGYVLRWGLGGAIVYGTIGLSMPLISDEPASMRDVIPIALLLGAVWAVIGAGVWVKDRLTGKLPKRPS